MKLAVSPPVQLLLVATIVGSAIVALRPEPVELPTSTQSQKAPQRGRAAIAERVQQNESPWVRHPLEEPLTAGAAPLPTKELPPLPPHTAIGPDTGHTPPLPSSPAAPVQPDVAYLGRMIKSDKVQVFLASHGEPSVVSTGDVFGGEWLVQSITSTHITLRHVGNGKTQMISMGERSPDNSTSVKTVQVGPKFLASGPAHEQASD